jgi:hypothetical protein
MHRRCRPVALPGFPPSRSNIKTVSSTSLLSEQVLASIWRIPWVLFRSRKLTRMREFLAGEETKGCGRYNCTSHSTADVSGKRPPSCLPERHLKATVAAAPMAGVTLWIKKQRTRFRRCDGRGLRLDDIPLRICCTTNASKRRIIGSCDVAARNSASRNSGLSCHKDQSKR